MDKPLFDSIVQQLLPEMSDEKSRKALIESALFGSPVVSRIDWAGAPLDFTRQLVNSLQYDIPLLIEVLNELKKQVGETRQEKIDALIEALKTPTKASDVTSSVGMRIFISYAHIDIWQIQQLAAILRDAQHEVWFDPDLKPGEEWKKRLADEIASCDVLLYALSNESVESEWCQWELEQAIQQKKRIMPVIVRPKTPVPQMLSHIQYIDFSRGPTPELVQRLLAGLESLSAVIDTDDITGIDPETGNSVPAQAEKQRKHVFISYHQANTTLMEDIQVRLRQENIPVWTDESNKTGASFWEDVIEEAIRNAGCVVAIMSPESRQSARVRGELAFADDCGVKIIPVIATGERNQVLSTALYALNPLDLRDEIDNGLQELINTIRETLEAPAKLKDTSQGASSFRTDIGFWDTLVRLLKRQRCVPFIGPGIDDDALPSKSEIAHRWAEQRKYPFEIRYARDLARVAQFVTIDVGAFPSKDDFVETWISGIGEPDFDGAQKPYRQLAEFDFPVFLTTNYHDFLFKALESVGKQPRRVFYCEGEWEASHDDALEDIPTVEQPLVFHLYGHQSVPESLILSEDDYLSYLVKTARNLIKLPTTLLDTIGKKSYLFIGFTVTDWDLRTLLHILSNQDRKGKEPHIAAQIEPIRTMSDEEQERRVKKYLEGVFRNHLDKRVNLYIGKTTDFLNDLREKWEESE